MVFYGTDLSRLAEDVNKGIVDYGFLPSGWLELNRPDLLPLLRVHGPASEAAVYEAEPYPFLTTTRLVPTYGLAAAPSVPWQLREQVRGERGGAWVDTIHPPCQPELAVGLLVVSAEETGGRQCRTGSAGARSGRAAHVSDARAVSPVGFEERSTRGRIPSPSHRTSARDLVCRPQRN